MDPDLRLLAPHLGPIFFFEVSALLDAVSSCIPVQYQGKLMIQAKENGEKPNFGPDLDPLVPNSGQQIFL